MVTEHFYLEGEGGYIQIVQKGNLFIKVSNEAALAGLLDDEEDICYYSKETYESLEEAFSQMDGPLEYALYMVERGIPHARFSEEALQIAKQIISKKIKGSTDEISDYPHINM